MRSFDDFVSVLNERKKYNYYKIKSGTYVAPVIYDIPTDNVYLLLAYKPLIKNVLIRNFAIFEVCEYDWSPLWYYIPFDRNNFQNGLPYRDLFAIGFAVYIHDLIPK